MLRPLLALVSLPLVLAAQGWVDRTPANSPNRRTNPAMCFDVVRGVTMLFNAQGTWTWNGTVWTQIAGNPLSLSGVMAMAHHAAGDHIVLVAGNGAWQWSGVAWTYIGTLQPTGAIEGAAMAYDPGRAQTVLFLALQFGGNATFVFDGNGWSQRNPAVPPVGTAPSMAFDAQSNRLLLATSHQGAAWFYEWNGSNWQQRSHASAPAVPGAMAGDAHGVVMFDAVLSPAPFHTWTFANGSSAQLGLMIEPTRRQQAAMAYDSVRGRFVLFGGTSDGYQNELGDTWEFERGAVAAYASFGSGCAGSRGTPAIAAQSGSLPHVGRTFQLQVSNLPITSLVFLFTGWSNTSYGPTPLPFDLGAFGAPGCALLTSGESLSMLRNVLGSAVWDVPIPALTGAAFYNQAVVFDPAANALGVTLSNGGHGTIGM